MFEKISDLKLDNLFHKEKPRDKKPFKFYGNKKIINFIPVLLMSFFIYISASTFQNDSPLNHQPSLSQISQLENESEKLIHDIFTQNQENYKNNFYKLKENVLLSSEGYYNILKNMNDTGILQKIQSGTEIVSLNDLETNPYLTSIRSEKNKIEMDFIVPFTLIENNQGIITKHNKQYLITFRTTGKDYLVSNITMLH